MKKIYLTLIAVLSLSYCTYAQNTTWPGTSSSSPVGIGTTTPDASSKLDVYGLSVFGGAGSRITIGQGGWAINRNIYNGQIYNPSEFAYQIGKEGSTTAGLDRLSFSIWQPNGAWAADHVLTMNAMGKVGISSINPASTFQVDDGVTKASIGSAGDVGSEALHWGTSYLGFNAARYYSGSGASQSWQISADGVNNGGGAIFGSIMGDIYFAPIATSGAAGRDLSDADIASRVAFRYRPIFSLTMFSKRATACRRFPR
jgi:hypothetical protein